SVNAKGILSIGNSTLGGSGTLTLSNQLTARGTDSFSNPFAASTGSILRVQGNTANGAATLTIANGFTANAQIQLPSTGGAFDATLNVTTGTLNIPAGTFVNALAGAGGNRNLNAQLANAGVINVSAPLTINKPD